MSRKRSRRMVFLPRAVLRGEGREHIELQPPRAMEVQGRRAFRPVNSRCGDHEELYFPGEEALPEGKRGLSRSDPESHLEYGEKDPQGKVKHLDVHKVAMEINGTITTTCTTTKAAPEADRQERDLVPNFVSLRDDGSTSSGNWLYCGSYYPEGWKGDQHDGPQGKRGPTGLGLYPNWAWAWPLNRRIIYNRASVDPNGNPWDPNRPVIKWNPANPATGKPGGWAGDVPDGPASTVGERQGRETALHHEASRRRIHLRQGPWRWAGFFIRVSTFWTCILDIMSGFIYKT